MWSSLPQRLSSCRPARDQSKLKYFGRLGPAAAPFSLALAMRLRNSDLSEENLGLVVMDSMWSEWRSTDPRFCSTQIDLVDSRITNSGWSF